MSDQHVEQQHPVRPLELFFDLVFVFGFTQVTSSRCAAGSCSPTQRTALARDVYTYLHLPTVAGIVLFASR